MKPEAVQVVDDHFFFRRDAFGQAIYAQTHVRTGPPVSLGVVVVPPIGRERVRISDEIPVLGHDLAALGFPVFRFDYRGEGESGGTFQESTVATRVADTVAAAAECRRRMGATSIVLLGLHLGATIAALAAEPAADYLILCDPVPETRGYVRNLLRANVFQQGQYFGEVSATESDLRERLRAGESVSSYGFPMAAPLFESLENVEVSDALPRFAGESLLLSFSQRPVPIPPAIAEWSARLGGAARCSSQSVATNFSWTTRRRWSPRLARLQEVVVDWLRSRTGVSSDALARRARPESWTM